MNRAGFSKGYFLQTPLDYLPKAWQNNNLWDQHGQHTPYKFLPELVVDT